MPLGEGPNRPPVIPGGPPVVPFPGYWRNFPQSPPNRGPGSPDWTNPPAREAPKPWERPDGPPICAPGQTQGCLPPAEVEPPPAAPGGNVAPPEAFAAWASSQQKVAESRKKKGKRKPFRPLQENLSILEQNYLKPAAERAIDAVKATAQQAAEEGLRYLARIVFRGRGKAVGKAITVGMGIVEQRQQQRPPKAAPSRTNPLTRVTPAKARPIPKPLTKPPKTKAQAGFSTRYAAPVVPPWASARSGSKSAPLPGQLQPVTVTGKRVLSPVQVTGKRMTATATPNPLTRPQTPTAARTATRTATPTRTATRTTTPTWSSVLQGLAVATAARAVTRSQTVTRTAPLTALQPQVLTLTQAVPQTLTRTQQKTCECKEERKKERRKRPPRTICYRGTFTETARGIIKRRKEKIPCPPSKSK